MGPPRRSALLPVALVLAFACLAPAPPARGHIVLGPRTLGLLAADSDVVARARIVDVRTVPAVSDTRGHRPTVGAALLEVMKGDVPPGEIRFAQHGHGVASYEPGEEVLLFLQRIERSAELDELAETGLAYISLQEHDEKYVVPPGETPVVVAAVRGYVAAQHVPDPAQRTNAVRQVTLTLLGSGDGRLAASAVQALVLAGDAPLVTQDDLPVLLPLLDDASLPIGVRVALVAELERRALLTDRSRWVALLASTTGSDRTAVIRAAGRHPSPGVAEALFALLAGSDAVASREAAIALGWPGHGAAVDPLGGALEQGDPRLRMAAIRGLGGIGTADARRVLEAASRSHPDPDTRRRARAEATLLARSDSVAGGDRP